jgi:hypothetical protein
MQIDFHHAVTYIVARWAGFEHADAEVVAYAAQYVDDATYAGCVTFAQGQMYSRTASAHAIKDDKNLNPIEDAKTWVPFHFLPGNAGKSAGEDAGLSFKDQIVCLADSPVAKDMLAECILRKDAPWGLHRLGITLHVYADTWAHQGFAGIIDDINTVKWVDAEDVSDILENIGSKCLGLAPLGHACVFTYPDMPFLRWKYTDHAGIRHARDNSGLFVEAADAMIRAMRRYRAGDPGIEAVGLSQEQRGQLLDNFSSIRDKDGDARHKVWQDLLRRGVFPGISSVDLPYQAQGAGSWKTLALGRMDSLSQLEEDAGIVLGPPHYTPAFLESNWKRFHDALQFHRLHVLNVLLPAYGICAA